VAVPFIQHPQGDADQARRTKVFISYSRADGPFADSLATVLEARGCEILIDRSDIYAFEAWWQRIEALIARSDAVVFVISPDAVASDVCHKEVAFAASLNKRFAPVVYRRADDAAIPQALSRLNFIFFDDEAQFDQGIDRLVEALHTDIDWIRTHTEVGEQARRWDAAGRPRGLLLRSPVLEQAEHWIGSRPQNAPLPTEDTQAFIELSRGGATTRRNVLTGSLAAGFAGATGLAGVAFWQRSIAVQNEAQAISERDRALRTQSLFLADLVSQQVAAGNAGTALLLALEGLPDAAAGSARPAVYEAEDALRLAWVVLRERKVLTGHEGEVKSAAFSRDGNRIVTASVDKTARLWDADTGRPIGEPLRGHQDQVLSAAFSPDDTRIVTASADGTALLWDAKTGRPIGEPLRGRGYHVLSAAFSPDGDRIVTADGTVRLWDAKTGRPIGEPLTGHEYHVLSAAFSPDGKRILAVCSDHTARLWDVETRKQIGEPLRGHEDSVTSAAFSPDGKRIVTASFDYTARLWDVETGKQIGEPLGDHDSHVESAAFNPDGKRIVTACLDNTARLWDADTHRPIMKIMKKMEKDNIGYLDPHYSKLLAGLQTLSGHLRPVRTAAFSPDGNRIVTASEDKTARLWEAEPGSAAFRLDGNPMGITWFSQARNFSGTQELVAHAKAIAPRCLSLAERKKFFLDPEPPAWYIEMEKWPYHTPAWKQWLADRKAGKPVEMPTE